jgi:Fe2+ or Zn2+ uptake regulation protein
MYAQITSAELNKLATLKASGLQTQVYLALASHAWGKDSCFPSLSTIRKALGNVPHINSIHRALKWLEDVGLIRRHNPTSKSRFQLILRKVKEAVKRCSNDMVRAVQPNGYHKKKAKKKNTSYSKRRDKKIVSLTKRKIAEWLAKMQDVQDLRDMRNNAEYSHLMDSCSLDEASYQYPPKPSGKWHIEDVKQAFREYGYGLAGNHWIFQYYIEHYSEGSSPSTPTMMG